MAAPRRARPVSGCAALQAEALVELDAELDEIADPGGSLLGQHRDRAFTAQSATGA